MMPNLDFTVYRRLVEDISPMRSEGRVVQAVGLTIEAEGLTPHLGELCHIVPGRGAPRISAEVVGFKSGRTILMPFGDPKGVTLASAVESTGRHFTVPVGRGLLGRVLDGFGAPLDGKGPLTGVTRIPLAGSAPHPLRRTRISNQFATGVRAIDGMLTVGEGQRMGIFAGSGVGKSTLLGMIARSGQADVSVIALIGERGREVQHFIERDLGPDGLARSVVVVATSDQPALARIKGAWVATAVAEYLRDEGMRVALLMDSVTRLAMAQREVGLAAGEPPTTKGYPPSVFAMLAPLLERAGTSERGVITGFYTVLVEGDDTNEPITDAVRSILDGHIQLSRDLASEGHYPPIDVLRSVSRVAPQVTTAEHQTLAMRCRRLLAAYDNARDLINIGAYVAGANPEIDEAVAAMPALLEFLRQRPEDHAAFAETLALLDTAVNGAH
jgi:FliI/YscN family ATPase